MAPRSVTAPRLAADNSPINTLTAALDSAGTVYGRLLQADAGRRLV
jgi:hypothetical protein